MPVIGTPRMKFEIRKSASVFTNKDKHEIWG
jgi:hypothetical protein